jgi:hypothetical protein
MSVARGACVGDGSATEAVGVEQPPTSITIDKESRKIETSSRYLPWIVDLISK